MGMKFCVGSRELLPGRASVWGLQINGRINFSSLQMVQPQVFLYSSRNAFMYQALGLRCWEGPMSVPWELLMPLTGW